MKVELHFVINITFLVTIYITFIILIVLLVRFCFRSECLVDVLRILRQSDRDIAIRFRFGVKDAVIIRRPCDSLDFCVNRIILQSFMLFIFRGILVSVEGLLLLFLLLPFPPLFLLPPFFLSPPPLFSPPPSSPPPFLPLFPPLSLPPLSFLLPLLFSPPPSSPPFFSPPLPPLFPSLRI